MDTATREPRLTQGERDRDALMLGIVALVVVGASVTGSSALVAASVAAAAFVVGQTMSRDGRVGALAVALVASNLLVVTVDRLGLPQPVALLPQLALVGVALFGIVAHGYGMVATPAFRLFLLYGTCLVLSTFAARSPGDVIETMQSYVAEGVLLWFGIINVVRTRRSLDRALTAFVLATAVLGLIGIIQFVTGDYTNAFAGLGRLDEGQLDFYLTLDDYLPRISGSIGEINRFAQILTMTVPLALVLMQRRGAPAAAMFGVAAVSILAGIALSSSRGAALAVIAALGALAALRVVSARAIGVGLAAIVVLVLVLPGYRERVFSAVDVVGGVDTSSGVDGSTLSRITQNIAALDMMADHPWLGVGPGGYPALYEEYAEGVGLNVRDGVREPHNLVLDIGAELGLIGLAVFGGMFVVILYGLFDARRRSLVRDPAAAMIATGMIAAIAGYLVTGVFLHLSFQRFLWLFLALADATARVIRNSAAGAAARPAELDGVRRELTAPADA